MAKKDFSKVDTTPVYESIAEATQEAPKKKSRKEYSGAEAEALKSKMQTQGRKGARMKRINMAFTPENHEYLAAMSRVQGESITVFLNGIIEDHRAAHADIYDKALEFRAMLQEGR